MPARAAPKFEWFRTIINHLQFENDDLIFYEASEDQIKKNVKDTLLHCEAISVLKIYFFKSKLIGFCMEHDCILELTDLVGCKESSLLATHPDLSYSMPSLLELVNLMRCKDSSLLATHLNLPLYIGKTSKALWNLVVKRMGKRLAT